MQEPHGSRPYPERMATASSSAPDRALVAPWTAPVLRALPAVVVGLAITFTPDHSATLGLIMLGAFTVVSSVLLVLTSLRMHADDPLRALHRGLAVILAVISASAFAIVAFTAGNLLPFLLLTLGAYGVFAGAYELVWGLRHRGRSTFARDGIVVGAGTVLLAVILAFTGDSVSAVGFFGAYAVILGVFLIIAGFSAKQAPESKEHPAS